MTHTMRKNNRQLPSTEALRILQEGEYGVLATCSNEGEPYGIPLSYAYQDGCIYFHCALGVGHKIENLKQNARACFTVVGKTQVIPQDFTTNYESAVAFGTVREITENKEAALLLLVKKYSSEFRQEGIEYIRRAQARTGVYEFKIEHLTAKGR